MARDVLATRLKVRPDVFFVRSADGVWLRNNVGSFSLRGSGAYELVRRLFGRLDGTRSFEEIGRALGLGDPRALYQRLMVPLVERGFVRVVEADASPISEALASRFGEHLAFLELYVDDPVATLGRVRREEIVCIGSGSLLRSMTVALAELGFSRVRLVAHEDELPAALEQIVEAVGRNDHEAAWALQIMPRSVELLEVVRRALETADARHVVIAREASARDPALAAACAWLVDGQRRVFVTAPAGAHVWATPALESEGACMQCIQRSMVPGEARHPGPAASSLAALQIAQRLFCAIAGEPVPQATELVTVNDRTLVVQQHSVRRHARCSAHRASSVARVSEPRKSTGERDLVRPDISRPTDSEALVALQDRLVEIVSGWVDPLVGPLLAVGEEALEQLPLSASRCRFIEAGPEEEREVIVDCLGFCARETRNQVVLAAIESMVEGLAPTLPRRVDLRAVGAGWSLGEALHRALAMAALRAESAHDERGPRTALSLEHYGSARVSFLLESLCGTRPQLSAHQTLSRQGLVVVELLAAGTQLARGAGLDVERALEHALLGALARHSSEPVRGTKTVVAHPPPRAERWDALAEPLVQRAKEEFAFFSMGSLVPFVGDDLVVVGVAPREHATGRVGP